MKATLLVAALPFAITAVVAFNAVEGGETASVNVLPAQRGYPARQQLDPALSRLPSPEPTRGLPVEPGLNWCATHSPDLEPFLRAYGLCSP
jgi:hypothetical protein